MPRHRAPVEFPGTEFVDSGASQLKPGDIVVAGCFSASKGYCTAEFRAASDGPVEVGAPISLPGLSHRTVTIRGLTRALRVMAGNLRVDGDFYRAGTAELREDYIQYVPNDQGVLILRQTEPNPASTATLLAEEITTGKEQRLTRLVTDPKELTQFLEAMAERTLPGSAAEVFVAQSLAQYDVLRRHTY